MNINHTPQTRARDIGYALSMKKQPKPIFIYASTIIGSPAADCANFGICQVDSLHQFQWDLFQPQHTRHLKARIMLGKKKNKVLFKFPQSGMMTATKETFFTPNGFKIDSTGHLPASITDVLGISEQFILPGTYPIIFTADEIILEVDTISMAKQKTTGDLVASKCHVCDLTFE